MTKDIFETLGLNKNPFSMAADTEGYFHTDTTKQILEELAFGIASRKGFLLLTGEVGVGKTSLLFQLLRKLEKEEAGLSTSWVFNTMLNKEELLLAIARDFNLDPPKTANVASLVEILQQFLVEQNKQGKNCAIIIDEAHNLSLSALEALRMLSNLELEGRKLVQILLVGQTEIKARMDEPKLRQLRSRISIYRELLPFSKEETGDYVNFKLASASSQFRLGKAPLKVLYAASLGNTRMINLIMERALYAAVAFGDRDLSVRALKAAASEIATCQVEVAERLNKKNKVFRVAGMAFAALVVLLLMTIPYIPSEAGPRSVLRVVVGSLKEEKTIEGPPAKVASKAKPSQNTVDNSESSLTKADESETKISPDKEKKKAYPEEYGVFLSQAGLRELLPVFAEAIENKKIGVFEQALPNGLQILQLEKLPSGTGIDYAAFAWKKHTGENPPWLIVWRPGISVQDFYYGYKSEDILALQLMLKKLGYYWGPNDGMVGPVTWRAINGFQKDMKLKRTMWPDPETIFWLTVMSEQHGESSKS